MILKDRLECFSYVVLCLCYRLPLTEQQTKSRWLLFVRRGMKRRYDRARRDETQVWLWILILWIYIKKYQPNQRSMIPEDRLECISYVVLCLCYKLLLTEQQTKSKWLLFVRRGMKRRYDRARRDETQVRLWILILWIYIKKKSTKLQVYDTKGSVGMFFLCCVMFMLQIATDRAANKEQVASFRAQRDETQVWLWILILWIYINKKPTKLVVYDTGGPV